MKRYNRYKVVMQIDGNLWSVFFVVAMSLQEAYHTIRTRHPLIYPRVVIKIDGNRVPISEVYCGSRQLSCLNHKVALMEKITLKIIQEEII